MRLLRTDSLTFGTFQRANRPPYVILSHRWSKNEDDEILMQGIIQGTATKKKAFAKLNGAMLEAQFYGYEWIWCDTCCIDKTSSAELSEAINSMFAWYKEADTCYVYISEPDISSVEDLPKSDWFSRGWTLQELLAPPFVEFYTHDWRLIANNLATEVVEILSRITLIDGAILMKTENISSVSIAERMSWAAHRVVSREEDMAYCLMGLFDVSMPMLYGEGGEKAFHRLQEHIMKDSNDHSIFAWRDEDADVDASHGLLADHPKHFAHSSEIIAKIRWEDTAPYQIGNRGLCINLHLSPGPNNTFIAALNCPFPSMPFNFSEGYLGIILEIMPATHNEYKRISLHKFNHVIERGLLTTVYVRQRQVNNKQPPWYWFQVGDATVSKFEIIKLSCFVRFPTPRKYFDDIAMRLASKSRNYFETSGFLSLFENTPSRVSGVVSFRVEKYETWPVTIWDLVIGGNLSQDPVFAVTKSKDSVEKLNGSWGELQPQAAGVLMEVTPEISVRVQTVCSLSESPFAIHIFDIEVITNRETGGVRTLCGRLRGRLGVYSRL
ncbi:HET-domain-containing protein [Acrodontium crateriforme]|uniref:HET-domain-containing protein n=1 Tax=Acrodontium crateriforme TaxID=150365 RepID=A0AAQ3R828_9PEZI|nr:HET-domain-containing protein [Acrodontium crateriforme]